MGGRAWTTDEVRYLYDNAHDGAEAIAEALGRTARAVERQAGRYGVSLRRLWTCTACGRLTTTPPSPVTGWCRCCSLREEQRRARERLDEYKLLCEEEQRRCREEERARQALYSQTHRVKARLVELRDGGAQQKTRPPAGLMGGACAFPATGAIVSQVEPVVRKPRAPRG